MTSRWLRIQCNINFLNMNCIYHLLNHMLYICNTNISATDICHFIFSTFIKYIVISWKKIKCNIIILNKVINNKLFWITYSLVKITNPNECSNRLWAAPGKTKYVPPSCLMDRSLWNWGVSMILTQRGWILI